MTAATLSAPPPRLYLGSFALGLLLQVFLPWSIHPFRLMPAVLGSVFLVLGGALARWSFATLKAAGNDPKQEARALVTDGPFALSRNPVYVAMTLLYVGAAGVFNVVCPLLLLPLLLIVMDRWVIRREEADLAGRFGPAFEAYRAQAGRWL